MTASVRRACWMSQGSILNLYSHPSGVTNRFLGTSGCHFGAVRHPTGEPEPQALPRVCGTHLRLLCV
jgi:hypothetical protein